jgi:HK97 family phage portal protein
MSILSRIKFLFEKRDQSVSLNDPRFWQDIPSESLKSGVSLSPEKAITLSAVYACVRVIAESIAQLPCILYQRTPDGKVAMPENPKYKLLHDRPNEEQTAFEFKEMFVGHTVLRGNAFAGLEFTSGGQIANIIPLNPSRMIVRRENGILIYRYTDDLGRMFVFPRERIWHLRGLSNDGIVGISPISVFKESLGLTRAAEDYAAQYFGNNAVPGNIVKHPGPLKPAARENLKTSLQEYAAAKRHMTLVLEEGMDWQAIGVTNKDSQFLESRNFQIDEICRMFNVPAILIHHQSRDTTPTYASAEQFALNFVKYTLLSICKRFEQSANRSLLTEQEQSQYFYEFKLDSLLRADIKTRYEAYSIGRQWGWLSPNDICRLENLDLIPKEKGGDNYITEPKNITGGQQPVEPKSIEIKPDKMDINIRRDVRKIQKVVNFKRNQEGAIEGADVTEVLSHGNDSSSV